MSFDWTDKDSIRINVVSWLPSEILGAGRERSRWELETLDEIPLAELRAGITCLSSGFSEADEMSVEIEAVAAGRLVTVCEYAGSLSEPERLGTASVAWRSIDERLARLWLIGGRPRAHYPEFMRQRRRLVERLSPDLRLLWMLVSLVRLEPLMAAMAGKVSTTSWLLESRQQEDLTGRVLRTLRDLSSRIAEISGERRSSGIAAEPERGDLGSLLVRTVKLAEKGAGDRTANAVARCAEEVFDTFWLIDGQYRHSTKSTFAKLEDRAWRDDADLLCTEGLGAPDAVIRRAGEFADAVRMVSTREDIQEKFLTALQGRSS